MATETFHPNEPRPQRSDPARNALAITPSDSADLANVTRGVYVGGSGDLKVTMANGQTLTFVSVLTGSVLPYCVTRIWATGTTATGINALW